MKNVKLRAITADQVRPGMGVPPAVVLVDTKFGHNASGVLRTCAAMGIDQLWITGTRWADEFEERGRLPREERMRRYGSVTLFRSESPLRAFEKAVPIVVEVQESAEPLATFAHPENGVYIFGPEDGSVPDWGRRNAHRFLILPTRQCLNLSVAVGIVLMDRHLQRQRTGLEPVLPSNATLDEQRGWHDSDKELEWR